jgi:hypothetical protein
MDEMNKKKTNTKSNSKNGKKSASDIRSEKAFKITSHINESATQALHAVRAGLKYV